MPNGFRMHAERTPNPNSLKWVLGRRVVEGSVTAHFESKPEAAVSPLARQLFEIDGVEGVFLAANFVTITRCEDVEWTDIAQPIVDAVVAILGDGGVALGPGFVAPTPEQEAEQEGELIGRIRRILDEEVRPAVAMDGGDIVFSGFRDGIVELSLRGSCSGCPSSTMTLKQGIEGRLMEAIPEVQGVVAV